MKLFYFIMLAVVMNCNLLMAQCACCGSSTGFSGAESSPGAFALGKNQWQTELYADLRYYKYTPPASAVNDHALVNDTSNTINNMVIGLAAVKYGISKRVTLIVQQPYFIIEGRSMASKTFGDLLTMANVVVYEKNNGAFTVQGGLEWPTGPFVELSNGNTIATGSGSYDPVLGAGFTKRSKQSNFRAGVFFKHSTKGYNDIWFGNFFGQQVSYNYYLVNPAQMCTPDSVMLPQRKFSLALTGQLSGELSQPQLKNHAYVPNTGAFVTTGSIGVTIGYGKLSFPVIFTLPLYQRYYGDQSQNTMRIRAGIIKTFN